MAMFLALHPMESISLNSFVLLEFLALGGTLIVSYIRRLGSSLGFKILNFNIVWVFRKMNIFGGMKILWIFFGFITQLDYI